MGIRIVNETPYADCDRPPPTGHRDEQGVFHPGPDCDGYVEHAYSCDACLTVVGDAINRGDGWARKYHPAWWEIQKMLDVRHGRAVVRSATPQDINREVRRIAREIRSATEPTIPRSAALVPAPRSLPAHWRRYAQPGPLIVGMLAGAGLWLLPATVRAVIICVLLVAAVAIRKYVSDAVPSARAIRR